eukprot:Gb_00695 [translate_table: standard]
MSAFHRELRVPDKAAGVVIGKGGSTMKAFQKTPGISSVRFSCGKVQIHGSSQEAVQQVASSIEELVNFGIDKSSGYFPDFFAFCFCKSVDDPFVAVNRICFEKFDSPHISNVSGRNNGAKKSDYCFKSGLPCELQGSSSSSSSSERSTEYSVDDDDLSAQVRSEPKRHGFVSFCREGKGTTDFRLGVVTHGTEMDVHPDMVEWIDKAWRNRTSDQLLSFDPPTRFLMSTRWDCVLSSRFNENGGLTDDMEDVMGNVGSLVKEAAKVSEHMESSSEG